jgi:hypothetical protein
MKKNLKLKSQYTYRKEKYENIENPFKKEKYVIEKVEKFYES